jgi:hypothetical protein
MSASGVKLEDGHRNALELGASGVKISSGSQIVLDSQLVLLGGAGGEPVIKGQSFLTLFATHVHPGLGSPPTPQGEVQTLSTAVLTK